jgi:hypothetical protein
LDLPESVQVGPVRYSIEASADKIAKHRGASGQNNDWAYAWHPKQEIVVDPDLKPDQICECVMHEILHAILRVSGLAEYLSDQEGFVSKFSPWLLDTLQRNDKLVDYFLKKEQ